MGLEHRPYIGTWKLNNRGLVQYTPDCIVYVNGDTALPGCPRCSGRIDLQEFITDVSVDAGVGPGDASASFSLALPLHHVDSFARDAQHILRPGLEVHIYMRGYFPVKGMYGELAEPLQGPAVSRERTRSKTVTVGEPGIPGTPLDSFPERLSAVDFNKVDRAALKRRRLRMLRDRDMRLINSGQEIPEDREFSILARKMGTVAGANAAVVEAYWRQKYPNAQVEISSHFRPYDEGGPKSNNHQGAAIDIYVSYTDEAGKKQYVPALQTWAGNNQLIEAGRIPPGSNGVYLNISTGSRKGVTGTGADQQGKPSRGKRAPGASAGVHLDFRGSFDFRRSSNGGAWWVWLDTDGDGKDDYRSRRDSFRFLRTEEGKEWRYLIPYTRGGWRDDPYLPGVGPDVPNVMQALGQQEFRKSTLREIEVEEDITDAEETTPEELASPLDKLGLGGSGIEDVISYPYYHVFHGVMTQVDHSWSGGFMTAQVNCSSLLHFWQYHIMSTQASLFGARPTNSNLKVSTVGHNFTGMHPYEIMYTLHHDMVGAAGGVGWALSQKTNVNAKTEVLNESLFSLNVRYWKRRFATNPPKLRFHGASGEVYSALQTAFLGRLSSGALSAAVKSRFADPVKGSRRMSGRTLQVLRASQFLGLLNKSRRKALQARGEYAPESGTEGADLEGVRLGNKPARKASTRMELNLVEMQAFVANIGNYGQFQLFESSYESKLDVAQKVMEITGFEFYQDVDGDYVFKPPMYNLDTSSARVYRIEDIDIISISFSEKEPDVTYITGKNSTFKNLITGGTENEWGVRGVYVDYRLVAQFGWRPGSFETAYLTSAKALFFSAASRMDIMNAAVNSASVVVPMRPELRPGYPLYIRYLDCFYYCNSFSHQFTAGGQCTTSLQLIAKRAKFYAPGDVQKTGIEAVDLQNTLLPRKPLQVIDDTGKPRLAGFPNVVMALDPNRINPLFFIVGADVDRIEDKQVLGSLVEMGVQLGVVTPIGYSGGSDVLYQFQIGEEPNAVNHQFYFDLVNIGAEAETALYGKQPKDRPRRGGPGDLLTLAAKYVKAQKKTVEDIKKKRDKLEELQEAINNEYSVARESEKASDRDKAQKKALKLREKQIREADKITSSQKQFEDEMRSRYPQLVVLIDLIERVGAEYIARHGEILDINSTTNLLEMLSDKKAVFTNGTQPGAYRYYSASHPDPAQQGQPLITYETIKRGDPRYQQGGRKQLTVTKASLDKAATVVGFLPSRQVTAAIPGVVLPEAQFGPVDVVNGIKVLTNNPKVPLGEVVPTSDIREMLFAVQTAYHRRWRTSSVNTGSVVGLGTNSLRSLQRTFGAVAPSSPAAQTIRSLYSPRWVALATQISASSAVLTESKLGVTASIAQPKFPSRIQVGRHVVPTNNFIAVGTIQSGRSTSQFLRAVSKALGASFHRQLKANYRSWFNRARDQYGISAGSVQADRTSGAQQVQETLSAVNKTVSQSLNVSIAASTRKKFRFAELAGENVYSPVFPVSDRRGYEVVGAFRYGRDVDIEPDGVFDVLHRQDPLGLLDRHTIDQVLDKIIKGSFSTSRKEVTAKGKTKVISTLELSLKPGDPEEDKALVESVQTQLIQQITARDLIDLGLFMRFTDDPSALEMSLGNWIAFDSKEGIHKIPINNAAFALADLTQHTQKVVCDCKAAEADVLLEAFGQESFVQFTSTGGTPGLDEVRLGPETDRATEWLAAVTARAGVTWRKNQDALRGSVIDRAGSTLIQSLNEAGSAFGFDDATRDIEQKRAQFRSTQAQLDQRLSQAGDDLEEAT